MGSQSIILRLSNSFVSKAKEKGYDIKKISACIQSKRYISVYKIYPSKIKIEIRKGARIGKTASAVLP